MPIHSLWPAQNQSLVERHEQLSRISQAMWVLLQAKLDFSDDQLRDTLTQIERSLPPSGVRLLDCGVCHHPVRSNAKCCLYCGTEPLAARVLAAWHAQH